jgi:hypothetical protein
MAFYQLPFFGHVEIRVDRRDPRPEYIVAEALLLRRRRRTR